MTYLVCGEALFDCFMEDGTDPHALKLDVRAGGSPFNVAIGIARLGGKAALLAGVSTDILGERLVSVLEAESVDTRYLVRSDRLTTLVLVGIDAGGHPRYAFYGENAADRSITSSELPPADSEIHGYHFGSYSLVVRPTADAFSQLAQTAKGSFVSVDPNVRPTIEPDLDVWRGRVGDFTAMSTLVKTSAEDLAQLYPGRTADAVATTWLDMGVELVVITDAGDDVVAWTHSGHIVRRTPPAVQVVDAVGAGDTFQAALLTRLAERGDPVNAVATLDVATLEELLDFSARAAAITCSRRGADLPRLEDCVGA